MKRYKYPRTPHLPGSPGATPDDIYINDMDCLVGREVVITEKLDGENTTLYSDGLHARSIDSRHHESRSWLKQFHASIQHLIPEDLRICGEYLYAKHSIAYDCLDSYFYMFSVWRGKQCFSWDKTVKVAHSLDIELVPVLYRGILTQNVLNAIIADLDTEKQEGFVVRLANDIYIDDFSKKFAKYVRQQHVQSDTHWMYREVTPNKLRQQ